jgi:GPH family glycoside/pentoside/hexuronide:cation symporter
MSAPANQADPETLALLERRTKLGYGAAEMGLVAAEVLIELYLLKFYNVVVGLAPLYTGLALGIAMIWDAVSDPLMGEISDQTSHPWGRRRPWLLPGAFALAATVIVIFNPPGIGSTAGQFFYLLFSYLALTTAMTVIGVPHLALGGEMSFDRDERTEIFGYRRLWSTLGLFAGISLPAIVLWLLGGTGSENGDASEGLASIGAALLIVITAIVTLRSTRDQDQPNAGRTDSLRIGHLLKAQFDVARGPIFRFLLAAFIVAGVGRALNASLAFYYYEFRLGFTLEQTVPFILMPFTLGLLGSIPFWVKMSAHFGKRMPAILGVVLLGALISVFYPILPRGIFFGPVTIAIIGGFLAGAIILMESLVADVVDVDELETGFNREGLHFGMWKMGIKMSRAGGLLLSGVLLQMIGFDASLSEQTAAVAKGIGWIFGPGVGGLFIVGALLLLRFPLTDAKHREIQAELLQRRAERAGD